MPSLVGGQRREGKVRTSTSGNNLTIEQDFHFRIRADSLEQDRLTVLHDPSLDVPKYGIPYGVYGMILKGADADRRDDDPLLWDAVYSLSNVVEEGDNIDPTSGQQQTGSPVEWLAVATLGFEDNDEVFRKSLPFPPEHRHTDIDGPDPDGYSAYHWTTSAGEPYQSVFIRQRRIITRDFTQFEPISGPDALTLDDIEDRNDVINSEAFLGRPKRTMKLTVESCEAGYYYGVRCWRVDYKLHYKKTDWRLKNADVGSFYYVGGARENFTSEGELVLGSLDGKSGKLADQNNVVLRYHKEFDEIDFNGIIRLV
jgi:hypothetical protein